MKMVSSAKLRGIEDALFRGRSFGESIFSAVAQDPLVEKKKSEDEGVLGLFADASKRHLCVLMTTDRGLCGAVNSSLARSLRRELNAAAKAKVSVKLITLGDKGRAQIARDYAPIVASAIDNLFDKEPIFPLAAAIASKVVAQPYDLLTLYYNHYENQAKYVNTYKQIPQMVRWPEPYSAPAAAAATSAAARARAFAHGTPLPQLLTPSSPLLPPPLSLFPPRPVRRTSPSSRAMRLSPRVGRRA